MALCVNNSGTWRDITTLCVNQSGTWRQVTTGCINQSGTWRCFGMVFGPNFPGASLGDNIAGGYLICKDPSLIGNIAWIVAPSSTEVQRTWYSRNDAVTTAEASAACGDWFVPNCAQLLNPGYSCRTYWDSYNGTGYYWTSSEDSQYPDFFACTVRFNDGYVNRIPKSDVRFVRAFRCVFY